MKKNIINLLVTLFFVIVSFGNSYAYAAKSKKKITPAYNPIETSLIVDGRTGRVLHAQNPNKLIYPASLTKVMTLYIAFEALEAGKISLNDHLKVSKYASEARPLKLYLAPGEQIKVKDAILGLVVKSANDAARVVAEAIGGSEQNFARLMTLKARQLGMKNTTFANASGWHDPKQKTTAIDLAKLAMAIKRDFPQHYHYFSETSFTFRGNTIKGHNRLTAHYPGAEGLKTGFTNPAGCNLITTATRGQRSLVGVVTGSKSAVVRDRKMAGLLDHHFGDVKTKKNIIASKKNHNSGKKKIVRKVASNSR